MESESEGVSSGVEVDDKETELDSLCDSVKDNDSLAVEDDEIDSEAVSLKEWEVDSVSLSERVSECDSV